MHKFLSHWTVDGLIFKSRYFPTNRCYSVLAEMLHCSFESRWKTSAWPGNLLSGSALQAVPIWSISRMAFITLSERCRLECVIRSPVFSKSVSVQCSVRLKDKGRGHRKKNWAGGRGFRWTVVKKGVVGDPRGCFGTNVRSRPCDTYV